MMFRIFKGEQYILLVMTALLEIYPVHPQPRLIHQVVESLRGGGVIVYPTDSGYALGCCIGNKKGLERIRQIRALGPRHHFTLMCRDLSEIAVYARVDNPMFRLLKAHMPGPYTFILEATKEVPKRVQPIKRKTIGIRIPEHHIALSLIEDLGEPMLSTSLILPEEAYPLSEAHEILERLAGRVDLIVDGGATGREPTSVIDLSSKAPEVLRKGAGDTQTF